MTAPFAEPTDLDHTEPGAIVPASTAPGPKRRRRRGKRRAAASGTRPGYPTQPPPWWRPEPNLFDNRFILGDWIGEGGFKQSHLAWDTWAEEEVVISLCVEPAEMAVRFIDRYHAVRDLGEHDNLLAVLIAALVECGGEHGEDIVYIASRPVRDSLPLGQRVYATGRPLDVAVILRFLHGTLSALHHLHVGGLCHGAPHYNNVLIDDDGVGVLVDFDWALPSGTTRLSRDAVIDVTGPHWVTPEQLRGEPHTARSDLYVVGIAAFVAATARFPFSETLYLNQDDETVASAYDFLATLHRLPPAPQAINPAIPQQVSDLILGMLVPDQSSRVPSAADALAQLERIAFVIPGREGSRKI